MTFLRIVKCNYDPNSRHAHVYQYSDVHYLNTFIVNQNSNIHYLQTFTSIIILNEKRWNLATVNMLNSSHFSFIS